MPTSLTATNFKLLYPEFEEKFDDTINLRIEHAKPNASVEIFGSSYTEAMMLLVAHGFAYSDMAAEGDEFLGKELIGYSAGGASHSFKASADDKDGDYKSTVYGRQFLAIRGRTGVNIPMAI